MSEETKQVVEPNSEDGNPQNNSVTEGVSSNDEPKCEKCEKTFVSARGLKRHMRFCTGKPPTFEMRLRNSSAIVTPIAGTEGITEYDLICDEDEEVDDPELNEPCFCCGDLLKRAHKNGPHGCFLCSKKFSSKVSLERHISSLHAVIPTFGCPDCECTCQDQSTLNRHRAMDHGYSVGKLFFCPQCNKSFTRKYHLDRHLQQTGCDGTPKLSLPCQVCGRKFSRKDNLREHLRAHMGEAKRKKSYECAVCNRTFYGTTVYNVHMRSHTGDKPFACTAENCTKKFASSNALKKHTRTHTGEKPYECHVCQNRFAAKETLNRHVKTHSTDKPFKCDFCGKSFIQSTQLRAHMFHHTGENGFECGICGKAFNRKTRLRLHERFIHEGEKPLECDECDKTFMRKEDLAKHKVTHTGVKEFQCATCNKSFATKASLGMHKRTHIKEEPRSCHTCGRAFIRRDCLYRHMRAKHREQLEEIISSAEKKKLRLALLTSAGKEDNIVDERDECDVELKDGFMEEAMLRSNIHTLLKLLIDEDTLTEFGWPEADVANILESVISRCGHEPASEEDYDVTSRIRENAKLLFTSVIDDETIKTLLNNRTVDEVILHVLKLSSNTNDDEVKVGEGIEEHEIEIEEIEEIEEENEEDVDGNLLEDADECEQEDETEKEDKIEQMDIESEQMEDDIQEIKKEVIEIN